MRLLLPIILVLVAIGLFFVYIDPRYSYIKELQTEQQSFDEALTRSKELQAIRDQLLARYNTFSSEDLDRLEKLLPDNIDNVKLVLELDSIASRHGMRPSNVGIVDEASALGAGSVGPATRPYETVVLSFSVSASYDDFIAFLKDLETNLRIVDLVTINFESTDDLADPYGYNVSIRTYWLK